MELTYFYLTSHLKLLGIFCLRANKSLLHRFLFYLTYSHDRILQADIDIMQMSLQIFNLKSQFRLPLKLCSTIQIFLRYIEDLDYSVYLAEWFFSHQACLPFQNIILKISHSIKVLLFLFFLSMEQISS